MIALLVIAAYIVSMTPFAQPAPPLVLLGDSLSRANTYGAIVGTAWGRDVLDLAIPGSTLDAQATAWLDAPPGPTLTIAGYNDMRRRGGDPATVATWEALLEKLARHRTAQGYPVYIGLCLRMTAEGYADYNPESSLGSDEAVAAYNAAIRRVASRVRGVVVVDTSAYDPTTMVGPDTVHPGPAGNAAIAEAFMRARQVWLPALQVDARPDRVVWSGAPAGCVYWIGSGRERVRLGCSRNGNYTPLNGDLYAGDLVEVRYPTPAGVLTGRAIVREE